MNPKSGFGKKSMSALFIIPYSFIDMTMEEVNLCKNGPFLTRSASAQQVKSSPCYQPDSAPGKYSQACLQELWYANSCNEKGKGFPTDSVKASFLMADPSGKFKTTNEISNYIYNRAIPSITRYNARGQMLSIADWHIESMFCLGRPIRSTCDFLAPGPRDDDCIVYLWNNAKAVWAEKKENELTPWCDNNSSLSPINPDGSRNQANIQYWKAISNEQEDIRDAMNMAAKKSIEQENDKEKKGMFMTKCHGKSYSDSMLARWKREEEEKKRKEEEARKKEEEARRKVK
jgi:hypothetical protein